MLLCIAPADAGAFYCPKPSADAVTCPSPERLQRLTAIQLVARKIRCDRARD